MEINPNQPQNQTKVPPPPVPEVSVRTMQSDIKSISQGEVNPISEIVAPKAGPTPSEPSFVPEVANQMLVEDDGQKSRKGLWLIIALVVVVGLAALGYFVIYPLFGNQTVISPVTEAEPQPVVQPTPQVAAHTSAFSASITPVPSLTAAIDPLVREKIIETLTIQAAAVTGGITEIALQDAAGGQIAFPSYLAALLPDFLDGLSASQYAADDFTAYLYKDDAGVWPGYIITLNPEGSATLNQWLTNLEKTDLSAFFLNSPGVLSTFKTGTVKGIADRFATGSTVGASFSYAVTGTQLIINTSFEGLKQGLGLLGY